MTHDGPLDPDPEDRPPMSWAVIETRVLRRVMAQVSSRANPRGGAPYYSMRVGTAQLLADGKTRISGHLSLYDANDAAELLADLSDKYQALRSEYDGSFEPPDDPFSKPPGIARQYRTRSR